MKDNPFKLLKISLFLVGAFISTLLIPKQSFCFNVNAQVDRDKISINESINLLITFEDGDGEIDTSNLTDFTIISQSSSSNISIINGKYSQSVTTTYTLIPKKEGILKIPQFKVEHKNQIYTTQEIRVEVLNQPANRNTQGAKDIFVESGISKSSLFVGEQAIYQLRFYSAIKLSNATLKQPSFNSFTAKEVGDRKSYTERINGKPYYVTEINYLLIPQTTGEVEIEPAVVICDVPVRSSKQNGFPDPFDDPFFSNGFFSFGRSERRQFTTDPIAVDLKALPPYPSNNRDNAQFSGLVGSFSIEAHLDSQTLNIGDSATLTITVSGSGNIMDATSPDVKIPSEFKVYDDSPEEAIELKFDGYSGKKVFKKAIVPVQSGRYTIEPIFLSFFDVGANRYETIKTEQISIDVKASVDKNSDKTGGSTDTTKGLDNQISSQGSQLDDQKIVKKKGVEFTGRDILSIKEDAASTLVNRERLTFNKFLVLFFLPALLFFLFKIAINLSKKELLFSEVMLKKAKMNLKEAENFVKNEAHSKNEEFLKLLHDALIGLVISKAEGSGMQRNFSTIKSSFPAAIGAMTSDEVTQILTDRGAKAEFASEVTAILEEIESARYSRQYDAIDYRSDLFEKVQRAFQKLSVFVIFISTFLIFSASSPILASNLKDNSDDSKSLFLEAIKDYHNSNFGEAAKKFTQIADLVKNPYLYYNIGNSYIKAGDIGRAILWYERAKKEIGLDPDLRFNLEYAQKLVTDTTEERGVEGGEIVGNVDILELIFFWQDYFSTQTIQYGAIAISFIFFSYSGFRVFRRKKIFTTSGVILFLALIFAGSSSFYSNYSSSNSFAVIVSKEASVRSGSSKEATQLFLLHAGTKVKVQEIKEDYIKILFTKEKMGWVSKEDAEII
ncbi:MAG: BatD family protein [Desulfamplus sp.]|nr:BatD family protein [Desulfamplus sp.]